MSIPLRTTCTAILLVLTAGDVRAETLTLPPQHRPEWLQRNGIVMAGDWEPLLFRVRRDGQPGYTPTPEQLAAYEREHSPEMIARLKALGVNFVMMHCYKGAGLQAERQSMADAAQFAARCHEAGLRVGAYCHQRHHALGVFFKEKPEAKEWAVLDDKHDHLPLGGASTDTSGTAIIRTPRPTTRKSSAMPSKRFIRTSCTSTTMIKAPVGTPAR